MAERKLYGPKRAITLILQKRIFLKCFHVERITSDRSNNDTFLVNSIILKLGLERNMKRVEHIVFMFIFISIQSFYKNVS